MDGSVIVGFVFGIITTLIGIAAKYGLEYRLNRREFEHTVPTRSTGSLVVMARATSRSGETQTEQLSHNPAGYHHNVIQRVYVEVV